MKLPADSESFIRTARLDLEPMLRMHAGEMFPLLDDPALHEFTGGNPPASELALAELYAFREARRSPDEAELWLNWLVRDRIAGTAVGYVQASISDGESSVAWVIATRSQGRGFATEAATALIGWLRSHGAPPAIACVHPDHAASQKVASGAGLRRTDRVEDGEEVWA